MTKEELAKSLREESNRQLSLGRSVLAAKLAILSGEVMTIDEKPRCTVCGRTGIFGSSWHICDE